MIFKTISGSIYELNQDKQEIRRLSNINDQQATQLQGENSWRKYAAISEPTVGQSVLIQWDKQSMPEDSGAQNYFIPGTITSEVVSISNGEDQFN